MSKQHHQTFDSWRLSRIAEEVDSLSFSSDGTSTPASSGSRDNTLERPLASQHSAKQLPSLVPLESLKMKAMDDSYFNSRPTVDFNSRPAIGFDMLEIRSTHDSQVKTMDDSYFNSRLGLDLPESRHANDSQFNSSRGLESLRHMANDKPYSNSMSGYCVPRDIAGASSASPKVDRHDLQEKDALRFIKEKYDSLGKVKVQKPQSPAEVTTNHPIISSDLPPKYSGGASCNVGIQKLQSPAELTVNHQFTAINLPPKFPCGSNTGIPSNQNTMRGLKSDSAGTNVGFQDMRPGLKSVDFPGREGGQGWQSPGSSLSQASLQLAPRSASNPRISFLPASPRIQSPAVHRSETDVDRIMTYPSPVMRNVTSSDDVIHEKCDITRHELVQVELFYSSHKTTISVCPCIASMHVGTSKSLRSIPSPVPNSRRGNGSRTSSDMGRLPGRTDWTYFKKGIPLLVLDSGEGRRKRRLHVILAEKGTGFTLWRDTIDQHSQYTARSSNFHTMTISSDKNRLAGFLFDDENDAIDFHKNFHRLATECERSAFSSSRESRKSKTLETKKLKKHLIDKTAISQPCCFTHVTKLAGKERCGILQTGQNSINSSSSPSLKLLSKDQSANDKFRTN